MKTLLNDARLEEDRLSGRMYGNIGTEDANRRPSHLHLDLKRRGDTLTGALVAVSTPGKRVGNALSHPVELKKLP